MTLTEITAVYTGSDGEATRALYAKLEAIGPSGAIAMNLFRACKASARAKVYSRRFRGSAYDKKQWSMDNLCRVLLADDQTIVWGWGRDEKTVGFENVLYVDLPEGQVSFHTDRRGDGPDYPGEWDGVRDRSAARICRFCADLITGFEQRPAGVPDDLFNGDHSF